MKKIFISQPMSGKTDKQIAEQRKKAVMILNNYFEEKIEVIDSIITDAPKNAKPLWYLSKSLELMSNADVVVFTAGWEKYRGCRIEHTCAVEYGIRIVDL